MEAEIQPRPLELVAKQDLLDELFARSQVGVVLLIPKGQDHAMSFHHAGGFHAALGLAQDFMAFMLRQSAAQQRYAKDD
jgi:hypothetical protein